MKLPTKPAPRCKKCQVSAQLPSSTDSSVYLLACKYSSHVCGAFGWWVLWGWSEVGTVSQTVVLTKTTIITVYI